MTITQDIADQIAALLIDDRIEVSIRSDVSSETTRVFTLQSSSPNPPSVEIWASDDAGTIDLFVGANSHYEIGVGERAWRRTGSLSAVEELGVMCRGLITNGFEEELVYSEGEIVASRGAIQTTHGKIETTSRSVGKQLFRDKPERITVSYSPLCETNPAN